METELGPDATGLGWICQYALVDKSGKHSLADLRSYQDWYLRYYLKAVPGVAEVQVVPVYDRSDLIHRAISHPRWTLVEVMITVSLIVLLCL